MNQIYFKKDDSTRSSFAKKYSPFCSYYTNYHKDRKIYFWRVDCNTQGQIIGLKVMKFYGCNNSIHVTLFKEFVKFHLTTAKDSNDNEKAKKHVVDGHNSKDV